MEKRSQVADGKDREEKRVFALLSPVMVASICTCKAKLASLLRTYGQND